MSEYQYYEFQAVDRPLTQQEMGELRALSSRARITSTHFVNTYNFGNFRGNPDALMAQYFDAFVYVANWGTHQLMLRLPGRLLSLETASRYCIDEGAQVRAAGDFVILEFLSQDEDGGNYEEGEDWMPSLLPLRAELAAGDLRCLYLGWLFCIQYEDVGEYEGEMEEDCVNEEYESLDNDGTGVVEDYAVEPPVPPGLGKLSAAQQSLVEFLGIDEDLIAVAAERSAPLDETPLSPTAMEQWVAQLTEVEKNRLLLRLMEDGEIRLRAELLQRFREATTASHGSDGAATAGRTVADLRAAAKERAEARRRAEEERRAQERARREREHAAARAKHLDRLAGRQVEAWRQVDALIATKSQQEYNQAVQLLVDLRELSRRNADDTAFAERLKSLRNEHARKPTLMQRFDKAGLRV